MTGWSRRRLDPVVEGRLLDAAAEAFARGGFERASLNAMLAQAGVGKSTFFYYFTDKEDLFAAVLEDKIGRVIERLEPAPLPEKPEEVWPAARDLVRRWGEAVDAEPRIMGLLRALQPLRRTAGPRLQQSTSAARCSFESLLKRGIALGAVRSDLDAATLVAMIEAIDLALDEAFHRVPDPDAQAVEAHRNLFIDTVERLLRPAPATVRASA